MVEPVVKLSGYVNVTAYDQDALTMAIFQKGPVSVGIDAAHKSLSFYANGVYYEPDCGKIRFSCCCFLGVWDSEVFGRKYSLSLGKTHLFRMTTKINSLHELQNSLEYSHVVLVYYNSHHQIITGEDQISDCIQQAIHFPSAWL